MDEWTDKQIDTLLNAVYWVEEAFSDNPDALNIMGGKWEVVGSVARKNDEAFYLATDKELEDKYISLNPPADDDVIYYITDPCLEQEVADLKEEVSVLKKELASIREVYNTVNLLNGHFQQFLNLKK